MNTAATYVREGHVATIAYNRPEALNAVNRSVRQALNAAWDEFVADDEAWVAILTGSGTSFSAGADMKDGAGAVGEWPGSFWEIPTINSFESGQEIWKPTIAAVQGYCIGYGLTAALTCDFIIAAEDAEFCYPEVKLGVPTMVGALRLPPKVGWANAMELLLTGDRIDAAHAKDIGLVWRVVPPANLLEQAHHLANRLCQGGPLAVRATKEMAHRSARLPWNDAVRMAETMRRVAGSTNDASEGRSAAAQKRPPNWTAT